jgi:hypothetical protein
MCCMFSEVLELCHVPQCGKTSEAMKSLSLGLPAQKMSTPEEKSVLLSVGWSEPVKRRHCEDEMTLSNVAPASSPLVW